MDCLSVGILVADHLCSPIERVPPAGGLILADHLELTIGGCAANAATDLAKLGVDVGLVACVGDDVFGQFITDTLASAGVNTSLVKRLDGVGTSGTLIVNVAGEDRRFIHAIGANGHFTAADIPIDKLQQAKVLYVGGYMIMPRLKAAELAEVFRQARELGVTTVLDVVLPGPGNHWPEFEALLPHTDVFLPNTDEAAIITGMHDPREQALRFRNAGAGTVVITCGDQGTVLVNDRVRLWAEVHKVDFVGGTGAGDAFDAGYIAGLLDGADERGCLAWGSALGASCVRSISATASVFTRDEALAYMQSHPLKITAW